MENIVIKLYDNENYEYPLIRIKFSEEAIKQFKKDLEDYQKSDYYNIDDFLNLIKEKDYFIEAIYYDISLYF